jgi:predicted O-methyltransferase YrrM
VTLSATQLPATDPTPIFEIVRGSYATELLAAAVAHFNVFGRLAVAPLSEEDLRHDLGLAPRPMTILLTALKAFGLLSERAGRLHLSALAREHLAPGSPFNISDYIGLAASSAGVREMVERLRTNRPAGAESGQQGAAFIYREGIASAMEHEDLARHLTLALAGRAKNVAPHLAARVPLNDAHLVLDVGGGTGIYSIALLQKYAQLRAVVLDRPEVLKVAGELARTYGVEARLKLVAGDMFRDLAGWTDHHPAPDVVLFSNVLHDWDVPQCHELTAQAAALLPSGGQLLIHDVFLNDALDGPLPIALYSAALFCLTEGRAYSAAEYCGWLTAAGLTPQPIVPTLIHCGVLAAWKA